MGKVRRLLGPAILLATLGLVAVSTTPALAQDPCADPQLRAALRQHQQTYAQLIQNYYELPPQARAQVDAEIARAFASTPEVSALRIRGFPDLIRWINQCGNWQPSKPQAPPTAKPQAQPTPKPQAQPTTKPLVPPKVKPPEIERPKKPQDSPKPGQRRGPLASACAGLSADVVCLPDVGPKGKVKLGWVLFGRTDLTDEKAKALYKEQVDARIRELEAAHNASADGQAAAERRREKLEESIKAKKPLEIKKALEDDLDAAWEWRNERLLSTGITAGELATGLVSHAFGAAAGAAAATEDWARFAKIAGQKAAKGEQLTPQDWTLAADGLISWTSVGVEMAHATWLGRVSLGLKASASAMDAVAAQLHMNALEKTVRGTGADLAIHQQRLNQQIEIEKLRQQNHRRQLDQLREEGRYLNIWRP